VTETLRGLTAAGPSQVGTIKAMRARDVSRPTDEDIAAAEAEQTGQDAGSAGSAPVSS
jgi:hypothetical protein